MWSRMNASQTYCHLNPVTRVCDLLTLTAPKNILRSRQTKPVSLDALPTGLWLKLPRVGRLVYKDGPKTNDSYFLTFCTTWEAKYPVWSLGILTLAFIHECTLLPRAIWYLFSTVIVWVTPSVVLFMDSFSLRFCSWPFYWALPWLISGLV